LDVKVSNAGNQFPKWILPEHSLFSTAVDAITGIQRSRDQQKVISHHCRIPSQKGFSRHILQMLLRINAILFAFVFIFSALGLGLVFIFCAGRGLNENWLYTVFLIRAFGALCPDQQHPSGLSPCGARSCVNQPSLPMH